jgi:hypothetical protein
LDAFAYFYFFLWFFQVGFGRIPLWVVKTTCFPMNFSSSSHTSQFWVFWKDLSWGTGTKNFDSFATISLAEVMLNSHSWPRVLSSSPAQAAPGRCPTWTSLASRHWASQSWYLSWTWTCPWGVPAWEELAFFFLFLNPVKLTSKINHQIWETAMKTKNNFNKRCQQW